MSEREYPMICVECRARDNRLRDAMALGARSLRSFLVTVAACLTWVAAGAPAVPSEDRMIEIDARRPGPVISPLLFGHNLEHTRRAIWQGISAEMVANRKFAATDMGMPLRWNTLDGGGVALDDRWTFAAPRSVRLGRGEGGACGIVQQHEWLTFRRGVRYAFRIWARAEADQTLRLHIADRPGFHAICSQEILVRAGDWRLWEGQFTAPLDARGARLQIMLQSPGALWVGAVSVMQADNFHGMRRDVIAMFKRLRPGALRWPGGCFAEYYPWRDGLLPVDRRPPIGPHQWIGLLPDTDGYDNHDIGTDEFIALCRELGCEPAITTRYGGGGDIREAADWVEYCNGSAATPMGRLRNERGYRDPYRVRYWYVGNEISGMSLVANKDRRAMSERSRAFSDAMLAVDPTITPIRCMVLGEPEWRELLVREMAERPAFPELILDGNYAPEGADMTQIATLAERDLLPRLRWARKTLDEANRGKSRVGVAYYEWNVMWDRSGDTLGGVHAATMLHMFCREAEPLGLVLTGYFQPITEGAIRVAPTSCELEPDGQVFELFAAHQANRLLPLAPPPAGADLDVCASIAPNGSQIVVTAVNRSTTHARRLTVNLGGWRSGPTCRVDVLAPLSLEVAGRFASRSFSPAVRSRRVGLVLQPCEVARLVFAGREGEAPAEPRRPSRSH